MRTTIFTASLSALVSCILSSCDTPVGQGAGWGAATGAIIGGAATGQARYAAIGAAAGAAAGALTGKIVQENQAAGYGPPPPGGYPYAMGGKIRVFLQPLYRSRLRSTRRAAWWTYSRRRYGSPFPQAIEGSRAAA